MNEFEAYNMQNRANLGQIWQMLARNMQAAGSASLPSIGSTYSMPLSYQTPSMFSQLQGVVSDFAGPEAGGLMELFANPAIRDMLPSFISDPITSMMQNAPIGGTADPAAFMFSQINQRQGRTIPKVSMPANFQNRYSIDLYNMQQQSFGNFMGDLGIDELDTYQPLEQLPENTKANENLTRATAFRNVMAFRNQNRGFDNAFALLNELDTFGPRLDDSFVRTDKFKELEQVQTEDQAVKFFDGTYPDGKKLKGVADAALTRANLASGLITGAQMLSSFAGGNPFQNAEMQGIGNLISDVFQLNENPQAFFMRGAQSLGNIGNLGLSTVTTDAGTEELVSNKLTASIFDKIQAKDSVDGISPYTSLNKAGLGRSSELMTELSRSGLLTTGGVDVFGNMSSEDVKKMEEALLKQLEGFSEIAKAGKRMGLKTQEVIQNLQSATGGRANEMLGIAADTALEKINAIRGDGTTEADDLTIKENRRRVDIGGAEMSASERQEFLRMEAQRRGGMEVMQQFEKLVESGRMIGLDARGSLAAATTGSQVLQSLGMNSMGGLNFAQDAINLVAQSRNTAGSPLTLTEAMTVGATKQQKILQNSEMRAFASLLSAVGDGVLDKNDPRVKELLAKGETGKLDMSSVDAALRDIAGLSDTSSYTSNANLMDAAGRYQNELSKAADRNEKMNVSGRVKERFRREFGKDSAEMTAIMESARNNKDLGLDANSSEVDLAAKLLNMNEVDRNAVIDSFGLDSKTAARFRSTLNSVENMQIDGMGIGAGNRAAAALLNRELDIAKYGATSSEITAEANANFRATIAKALDAGNSGDALIAGIRSVRNEEILRQTRALQATEPNKFSGIVPNEIAKREAAEKVKADPANKNLSDKELAAKIDAEAARMASASPEAARKYGILLPTTEALERAQAEADKRIAATIKEYVGKDFNELTPEQQKAVLGSRAAAAVGLLDQTTTTVDASQAMSEAAAKAAVVEEGVSRDEFEGDLSVDADVENLGAFKKVREAAAKDLEKALVEKGVDKAAAFEISQRANISFEDLEKQIQKSNLTDVQKLNLQKRLDEYRDKRIQAKQQGEQTTDAQGNQIQIKAIDAEDAADVAQKINENTAIPLTEDEAKLAASKLDPEKVFNEELIKLQAQKPELFTIGNIDAYKQAVKDTMAKGLTFTDILKAVSGDTSGRLKEVLPQIAEDLQTELDSLADAEGADSPENRKRKSVLERQLNLIAAYNKSQSKDPKVQEEGKRELALQEKVDQEEARLAEDAKKTAEAQTQAASADGTATAIAAQNNSPSTAATAAPAAPVAAVSVSSSLDSGQAAPDKAPDVSAPIEGPAKPLPVLLETDLKTVFTAIQKASEKMVNTLEFIVQELRIRMN